MTQSAIARKLWYDTKEERVTLTQADLIELTQPLVILAEPGMGKTRLLEWLADAPGYTFCTARKLINVHNPKSLLRDAQVIVIDALDEVSTRNEGEAVDQVLRRLGELDYPLFILSCRVADWRSATGMETIREQYEEKGNPLELHLDPFDDNDAIAFLSEHVGDEDAKLILDHFHSRGLRGFLGNPQTLELITDVAGNGPLPENRSELFERAVTLLRVEASDAKWDTQLAPETALDAAGAAFAALILTGNEAIVRKSETNNVEGELSIANMRQLPGCAAIDEVIGTRLFKASGVDRFSYWHRRIGEYLGARWLAKLADSNRKRRRILSLFQSHGLVPASLRGLHAWLAQHPGFTAQVIAMDPMGVIEYGDTDDFTPEQGRILLRSLEALARRNPDFRVQGPYALKAIVRPALVAEVRALLADRNTPFGIHMLILEALVTSTITGQLEDELLALFLDASVVFAVRRRSADALASMHMPQDWQTLLVTLLTQGGERTLRLAIEVMHEVGYQHFTNELVIDLTIAFAKCGTRVIGLLAHLQEHFPVARLQNMLDCYVEKINALEDIFEYQSKREMTDVAYHWVTRRLAMGPVEPSKVWYWLQPFESDAGGNKKTRAWLAQFLKEDSDLRIGVLRHVLLEHADGSSARAQYWQLIDRSSGFEPTSIDIITLLAELDPSDLHDERWRDLVQLIKHCDDTGAEVRRAAYPFAAGRPALIAWIDNLPRPPIPEWQIEQTLREQRHQELQAKQQAEHRQVFAKRLDTIRQGEFDSIVELAMAYLNMYHNIGCEDVPAHERLRQWLGEDVDEAAGIGFETYFSAEPLQPGADEIAASFAQGSLWNAGYIFVAALAERHRKGTGFRDLDDERVMAGFFVLRATAIDDHARIVGLEEAIKNEICDRGLWIAAMRRYLEPQLQVSRTHIDGLGALMRDESSEQMATVLAAEWLVRFPDIPAAPEAEIIDRLILSRQFGALKSLYSARLTLSDSSRRLNWTAVGILTDFDAMMAKLMGIPVQRELLWHIRDRANGGHRHHLITLATTQLEWLIKTFRPLWPMVGYPNHVRHGDRNAWDASDLLGVLIRRMGTDPSTATSAALHRLVDAIPDGYTTTIRTVAAEQQHLRVESTYRSPTLAAIQAIASDRAPASIDDLQTYMIEELMVVQDKIKGDDTDSWRGFFDDKHVPYDEERCRDQLLGMLRQGSPGVILDPETHVGSDKEVDITCSSGKFRLPIEIKGQWHSKLWQAADTQLDQLYAQDWRAGNCGIYLVLWFGNNVPARKSLYSRGRGLSAPSTSDELRDMLSTGSKAAREGRISIVVLNLERT